MSPTHPVVQDGQETFLKVKYVKGRHKETNSRLKAVVTKCMVFAHQPIALDSSAILDTGAGQNTVNQASASAASQIRTEEVMVVVGDCYGLPG